jgi:hypothetical protein
MRCDCRRDAFFALVALIAMIHLSQGFKEYLNIFDRANIMNIMKIRNIF